MSPKFWVFTDIPHFIPTLQACRVITIPKIPHLKFEQHPCQLGIDAALNNEERRRHSIGGACWK